jgi:hypothetical protein
MSIWKNIIDYFLKCYRKGIWEGMNELLLKYWNVKAPYGTVVREITLINKTRERITMTFTRNNIYENIFLKWNELLFYYKHYLLIFCKTKCLIICILFTIWIQKSI